MIGQVLGMHPFCGFQNMKGMVIWLLYSRRRQDSAKTHSIEDCPKRKGVQMLGNQR